LKQERDFDPDPDSIIPVYDSQKYTLLGKAVIDQPTASKQIESLVPISGTDQFGSLERYLPPQLISRPLKNQLYINSRTTR
jgi:hypothetical protein